MRRIYLLLVFLFVCPVAAQDPGFSPHTPAEYAEDFDALWHFVRGNYVYFEPETHRWESVRDRYREALGEVRTRGEFVSLLERVVEELRDHHAHLGTHTASSPNLVPSRTDLWGEWEDGRAVLAQVRPDSPADSAGLEAGTEVVSVAGEDVVRAACRRLGRLADGEGGTCPWSEVSPRARDWALNTLLAGRRTGERRLELRRGDRRREVKLLPFEPPAGGPLLEQRILRDDVGYVRVRNSLGDRSLVPAFDAALDSLRGTEGLVLDLRDTPGGGNTVVARGIMGRLVERVRPYQTHRIPHPSGAGTLDVPRSWTERVAPRGPFAHDGPVVVLVDHWTGSMGEGIAIGLDGMGRATVVGTPMAGLRGATYGTTLPNTGIPVSVPGERLYHVDGTPREAWVPPVTVDLTRPHASEDPVLAAGLEVLAELRREASP